MEDAFASDSDIEVLLCHEGTVMYTYILYTDLNSMFREASAVAGAVAEVTCYAFDEVVLTRAYIRETILEVGC